MSVREMLAGLAAVLLAAAPGTAATIQTVHIGNACNASDDTGYGRVDYEFNIDKYEVSNAEYAEFLNAEASVSDPHGLYHDNMSGGTGGIARSGSPGSYGYSTIAGRGNMPVWHTSFWDACRFANWLHNGQPSGVQDLSTTEDGAYFLNGVTNPENASISRGADWKWAIPNEDEWYKAAYYDPDKPGGAGYWEYPTASDTAPTAEPPPGTDGINGSADFKGAIGDLTDCGAYYAKPSASAYGTYDQGGNLWERNEAIIDSGNRALRGGAFPSGGSSLSASSRNLYAVTNEGDLVGFRVVQVPEPAALSLLAVGGLMIARRRRSI